MSELSHEQRLDLFYAKRDLSTLLHEWCATSDDVKRGMIAGAITALEHVPLPDDLADESGATSKGVTDES